MEDYEELNYKVGFIIIIIFRLVNHNLVQWMVMDLFLTKVAGRGEAKIKYIYRIKQNTRGPKAKAYHGWLKKSDRCSFSAFLLGSPATSFKSLL